MNKKTQERKVHTIDAEGKSLGRLATGIAVLLRGKHKPGFTPHEDLGDEVVVKNLEKASFSGDKFKKKVYYSHTGYLGHLRQRKLEDLWKRSPLLVLQRTVFGMLPKNKLREKQIKRLKIER